MTFCMGCGKLLSNGAVQPDGVVAGVTLEGVIVQPVKDGVWVHCVGCYKSNGCAALFPDVPSIQKKAVVDFPVAAVETKAQWRARLAQKAGVAVDNPDLVASFNKLGI